MKICEFWGFWPNFVLFFKLMVTLLVAYGVYLMKHPEASFGDVMDLVLGGGVSQKVARDVNTSKKSSKSAPPDPKLPPCQQLIKFSRVYMNLSILKKNYSHCC